MCEPIDTADPHLHRLDVLSLCEDFSDHLRFDSPVGALRIVAEASEADMSLVAPPRVLTRILRMASAPGICVQELDYFDVDYRSELALTHESRFSQHDAGPVRVHFFKSAAVPSTPAMALDELLASIAGSYSGYSVLRPNSAGTVGRSLIKPPDIPEVQFPISLTERAEVALRDGTLRDRVRTGVAETVTIGSTHLEAKGVPFMEQMVTYLHVRILPHGCVTTQPR